MARKPEVGLWLKLFQKVTTGRASIEECNELGISESTRRELYRDRDKRRKDCWRHVSQTFEIGSRFEYENAESPEDALIEMIDRKNGKK